MILILAVCGVLFALGGTGWKPARRFGIPLFLAGIALFMTDTIRSAGLLVCLIIALSLGYGESKPYWYKALVFLAYGLSFLWIGFSLWVVLTPILCLSMFWLSNLKLTANAFFWKAVEFLMGVFLGITFISCIGNG